MVRCTSASDGALRARRQPSGRGSVGDPDVGNGAATGGTGATGATGATGVTGCASVMDSADADDASEEDC